MIKVIRIILLIVGGLAVLLGLVWAAQGAGIFPYPKSSYMIGVSTWIYRGLALAVGGLLVIFIARKL